MNLFPQNKLRTKNPLGARLLALFCLLFFMLGNEIQAQKPIAPKVPPPDTSKNSFIHIRYADELNYSITPKKDTLQKLIGQVELNQDTVFLFCDSATIMNGMQMVAQGNFIMQQGDSMTIFADSAEYSSDTKIADLYSNVSMLKGLQKLFTERLTYDAESKIATYLTGATMTDDTTFLKSTRGYFHAKTDDIFFKDSVVVVNPDFSLRSDTLKFNARTKIVTFLAPTLIIQDTARIYTESGYYDINKKFAVFSKNPQYVKNDQKAWADRMTYDGNKEEVTLIGNAHFEDSTSVATAEVIRRNEKTGVTTLEGNGYFKDDQRTFTGDTIVYDSKNETYSTRGRSHIVDGEQILEANQVDYIKEREIGIATGNVIFRDTSEKMTVICEYAEHSKKRNYLKAHGGRDSLGNPGRPLMIKEVDGDSLFISADTLISFVPQLGSPQSSVLSLQSSVLSPQPLNDSLQLVGEMHDSLFFDSLGVGEMAVDSLMGNDSLLVDTMVPDVQRPLDTIPQEVVNELDKVVGEIAEIIETTPPDTLSEIDDETDTPLLDLLGDLEEEEKPQHPTPQPTDKKEERVILAYHDVRIYKSDLQALCDSLSYNSLDSMFRLFKEPIIWSDTSQFTANHVRIQMANDAIDRIFMEENSFIVNTPDEIFFNQIKGRNSTAFFDSSELQNVRVVGNAESVYYALDDEDAYIGVNKTVCSDMKIIFGNNEVEGIVFYDKPTANLYPMKEADHAGLEMPGFSWQIDRRPNNVEDLVKINKQRKVALPTPQMIEEEMFEKVEKIIPPVDKGKDKN